MTDQSTALEVAAIRQETLEKVSAQYDELDTNGDGNVDREELVNLNRS